MSGQASDRCVLCDAAHAVPDGRGGILWVRSMATPLDCEHETLDGRQ